MHKQQVLKYTNIYALAQLRYITKAFRYEDAKKYTIEELNRCVPEEYRVKRIVYQSDLTLAEAKNKYPDWYEKRIVRKQPKGSWICNRALYDWWIKKIYSGAEQGHRYWCILALAAYVIQKLLESMLATLISFLKSPAAPQHS